jgi:cell wall-associated NlpC family hydrolase
LRPAALGRTTYALVTAVLTAILAAALAAPSFAETGGAGAPPPPPPAPGSGGAGPNPVITPGAKAQLSPDGRVAIAPADAPEAVKKAIYAANQITNKPYRYGGGHRRFRDSGYDCSGAVSYALRGAAVLRRPLHSRAFMRWGEAGAGQWITVYTNPGHAYVTIAGLRFDTSGPGERGPRWRKTARVRSAGAFQARHPTGF